MKTIEGDLIALAEDGDFDIIIHGCNCMCNMGAGIAKTIRILYPEAYKADCQTEKASKGKLGTYSSVGVSKDGNNFTIVNAYTQFNWRGKKNADYEAIRAVFKRIKSDFTGLRLGYPLIGAGLAGGDWSIISAIIEEELNGEDHTLVKFNG